MKLKPNGWTLLLFASLMIVSVQNASAVVELKLSDGLGHTVDIVDGTIQDASNSSGVGVVDGAVSFIGAIGKWKLNVSTALSGGTPILDVSSLDRTSVSGAGILTISASDSGYSPASQGFTFDVGGTTTLPGILTFQAFGGNSNTKFDMSHQIGSTMSFSTSSFSGTTSGNALTVNPYSLTIVATINYGLNRTGGTGSFDAGLTANPIPEPAVMSLLGGVLLLTVGAIRRKVRGA